VVEAATLDDLIAAHGLPHFAKIDVEGFELEVLMGLSQPLRRCLPNSCPRSENGIPRFAFSLLFKDRDLL
jgi:hypothetical protein